MFAITIKHELRSIEIVSQDFAFYECDCGKEGRCQVKNLTTKELVLRTLANFEKHKNRSITIK